MTVEQLISIHAPRVGSDKSNQADQFQAVHFNPRSPCGERQAGKKDVNARWNISIHAPRVGSDQGSVPVFPAEL